MKECTYCKGVGRLDTVHPPRTAGTGEGVICPVCGGTGAFWMDRDKWYDWRDDGGEG